MAAISSPSSKSDIQGATNPLVVQKFTLLHALAIGIAAGIMLRNGGFLPLLVIFAVVVGWCANYSP